VLLNNDTLITQANWLHLLQETAYTSTSVGVVGCRLVGGGDMTGKLLHAGSYIYPETHMGQQIGGLQLDVHQYTSVRDVQGVVFACTYLKRTVLNQLGMLDTRYFAYFDDTDYCLQALTAGYRVVYDGRVEITHFHNTSTKENRTDFWSIYMPSRQYFQDKWDPYLRSRYEARINWTSTVNLPIHGYTDTSRNIMISLDDAQVFVKYRYAYGPGTPIPLTESTTGPDDRIDVFRQRTYATDSPEVVYGQGDVFYKNTGSYKIGFTMLEVDGLPKEWVHQCNQMDEVWVPSRFNLETFRNSGVHVPMHIIPLGIDPNYFHPGIRGARFSKKFTFLSVFEWGERKNPARLIETFCRAFAPTEDVVLVCKIINNDPSVDVPAEIRKLHLGHHPQLVILHNEHLPAYLMGSLYASADCFVLPTSGEGWGMPILEAMACGLPVIATDWSAQQEFLSPEISYPIQVKRLIPAEARCVYYQGFQWAEPDLEHTAALMRHVYEHQAEAEERGLQAAREIQSNWTWSHTVGKIKARLHHGQR